MRGLTAWLGIAVVAGLTAERAGADSMEGTYELGMRECDHSTAQNVV